MWVFDVHLVFPLESVDTTVGSKLAFLGHTPETNHVDNPVSRRVEVKQA